MEEVKKKRNVNRRKKEKVKIMRDNLKNIN